MTKNRRAKPARFWLALSAVNLLCLLLLRSAEALAGSNWLVALLSYLPPVLFLPPALLLTLLSLVRRRWVALVLNTLACVFVVFALMGLRVPLGAQDGSPSDLRVMTYNVDKWSHGGDAVASVIRQARPDVFCLQEAGDYFYVPGHQPHVLARALPEYHFVTQGEIVIASRYPVLSQTSVPLPPGPSSRPALEVVLQTPRGPVAVIAVHLLPNALDQDARSPRRLPDDCRLFIEARASQNQALLTFAATIRTPLVICGDFNAQPQTAACRELTRRYPDAFDLAGSGFGYTLTSDRPLMRIDHVLIRPGMKATRAWVPDSRVSDHRPLIAVVRL